MQLGQALIFVDDLPGMLTFYRRLGLVAVDGDPATGFVRLRDPAGGAVLALHYSKAVGAPTGDRTDTAIKLGFHVDDVDAARAELVTAGATMREINRWDGGAFCDGVDPEGNIFQITTR